MSNASLVNGHIDRPKMTDEEVIKALECCLAKENCEEISCENCPYDLNRVYECKETMLQNAIDLINRLKSQNKEFDEKIVMQMGLIEFQKEEIKKLENIERIATKTIETQSAEIERLRNE